MALVLSQIKSWLKKDVPLFISGIFPEGIGASGLYNRGDAYKECIAEFGGKDLLQYVPMRIEVAINFAVNTLLNVKNSNPEQFKEFDIDWQQYFLKCWFLLRDNERAGVDVSDDKQEFFNALSRQPEKIRSFVQNKIESLIGIQDKDYGWIRWEPKGIKTSFKEMLREVSRRSKILNNIEKTLRYYLYQKKGYIPGKVVSGDKEGFKNILECSRKLPKFLGFS